MVLCNNAGMFVENSLMLEKILNKLICSCTILWNVGNSWIIKEGDPNRAIQKANIPKDFMTNKEE